MSDSNTTVNRGGMGLLGWLFIIFLVLKLNPGGHLDSPVEDWSWWWVTAPLWGALVLVALIFAGLGIALLLAKARRKKRQAEFQKMIANRRKMNTDRFN